MNTDQSERDVMQRDAPKLLFKEGSACRMEERQNCIVLKAALNRSITCGMCKKHFDQTLARADGENQINLKVIGVEGSGDYGYNTFSVI